MSFWPRELTWRVEQQTGCWIVTSHKPENHGYVRIKVGGKYVLAHRYMYEKEVGPIADGMDVCHTCDVPNCICPQHLFQGTHTDNMLDMRKKGRAKGRTGEPILWPMLKDEDKDDIRHMSDEGIPQRRIAAKYGISQRLVWDILHD